jgi:hypothetical protein
VIAGRYVVGEGYPAIDTCLLQSRFRSPTRMNRQDAKDAKGGKKKIPFVFAFSWRPWRLGGFAIIS